ncbi:DnaJ-domain-containing protein [Phlegmacium glaucopus]|nr:DnaJ-domain-containing protein [Phlegmacium glaucopus]
MTTPTFKNFYDILGIEQSASADDVRRAYRKKALETHPDKLDPGASEPEKQDAEQQFHKVREAFETLGDAVKRKAYDIRLRARASPQSISEEAQRRMKERKAWAERQRENSEKRMAEIKAQREREKQEQEAAKAKRAKEAVLVAEMLREMNRLNPEFAARRQAVLQAGCFGSLIAHLLTEPFFQRKAERERAAMRNQFQTSSILRHPL